MLTVVCSVKLQINGSKCEHADWARNRGRDRGCQMLRWLSPDKRKNCKLVVGDSCGSAAFVFLLESSRLTVGLSWKGPQSHVRRQTGRVFVYIEAISTPKTKPLQLSICNTLCQIAFKGYKKKAVEEAMQFYSVLTTYGRSVDLKGQRLKHRNMSSISFCLLLNYCSSTAFTTDATSQCLQERITVAPYQSTPLGFSIPARAWSTKNKQSFKGHTVKTNAKLLHFNYKCM